MGLVKIFALKYIENTRPFHYPSPALYVKLSKTKKTHVTAKKRHTIKTNTAGNSFQSCLKVRIIKDVNFCQKALISEKSTFRRECGVKLIKRSSGVACKKAKFKRTEFTGM